MELVYVPWGWFAMGDDDAVGSGTERRHLQSIAGGYWIGRNDVTWREYLAFCEATNHPVPPRPPQAGDGHPVVNVSWDDAKAFCAWAGLVLPTEVEWECAARGRDGRSLPWGSGEPTPERCVSAAHPTYGGRGAAPVGCCPAGASPWGALDMVGNVWQWVDDPFEYGQRRIRGGGSWRESIALRATSEVGHQSPGYRYEWLGFRALLH
jgi:formylglycine-generating enzyme required for sulfatase activity